MKQSNVKTFVSSVCLSLVLTLALLLTADGQGVPAGVIAKGPGQNSFSVGATNNGTSVAWCTVSANSQNGGTPVVTAINAGSAVTIPTYSSVSNFAGAVIAWRIVDQTSANYTNTTTSVPVTATNSFVAGDLILVRHMTDDVYERIGLTTATSGTNLTLSLAPAEPILPGDMIYRLSATNAAYVVQWNNATNTLTGNRVLVGQKGLPLHLSLTSSGANAALLNVTGYYETDTPVLKSVLGQGP